MGERLYLLTLEEFAVLADCDPAELGAVFLCAQGLAERAGQFSAGGHSPSVNERKTGIGPAAPEGDAGTGRRGSRFARAGLPPVSPFHIGCVALGLLGVVLFLSGCSFNT